MICDACREAADTHQDHKQCIDLAIRETEETDETTGVVTFTFTMPERIYPSCFCQHRPSMTAQDVPLQGTGE